MSESIEGRYKKIVVPIDGSQWSEAAIPHAVDIAISHGSELILLHVFKPPANEYIDQLALAGQDDQLQALREEMKQHLMSVRNKIRSENVPVRVQFIEGTGVPHIICEYIKEEKVDLVVMTSHGHSGILKMLFGSVAQEIMHNTHVPVMIVRPGKD